MVRDQEGGKTEGAKLWNPVGCSMSTSYRRWAAFGPAGPVPASGPTAMTVRQSTYTEAGDCISPIPCRLGENGKTWLRSSPSSMPVVGSAAVAPVSLALDLKNGTHCSFPLGQSAAFLSIQPPWFLVPSTRRRCEKVQIVGKMELIKLDYGIFHTD